MKNLLLFALLFASSFIVSAQTTNAIEHVVLVTWDGFRWQELFEGAQPEVIKRKKHVADIARMQTLFDGADEKVRREKLLPFFWTKLNKMGSIYGNRHMDSKVDVHNPYNFSYPGYNELFSGYGDKKVNSNDFPDNPNQVIFDALQLDPAFHGKVAAFATWDAFPRIINTKRNATPVYVNVKTLPNGAVCNDFEVKNWSTSVPPTLPLISHDSLTYHLAKEYMSLNHPRFVFIGFDETDENAHQGRYDAYLYAAHQLDSYMDDLWNFIQNDPKYKDHTMLVITCDHGRGPNAFDLWRHHAQILVRSSQTWFAMMGPGISSKGEVAEKGHLYQDRLAATLMNMLGVQMKCTHPMGNCIQVR